MSGSRNIDLPLAQDFLIEVAKGDVPNNSLVIVNGKNDNVDTSVIDIGMESTNFTWLTSATTLEAISDDADDTIAGSGARIITVFGLDSDFNPIEEDIEMNGNTVTSATSKSFIRVNSVVVKECGTYATTGAGANIGNIIIRVVSGGATQSFISNELVNNGISQDFKYTVPNGHKVIVQGVGLVVEGSKVGKLIFQTRRGADIVVAPFTSKITVAIIDGESGGHNIPKSQTSVPIIGKTDIWGSAIATSVNTEVSARMLLLLIKD